ncbi:MAG: cell division protein FtsL [Pseudomonadota bacterium]|nr:cell division protein FtsL [Pseudomonadota bacterium]
MSGRLNLLLLFSLIVCALSVITAQNKERLAFISLQHEQAMARKMDVKWGQLELEESTWAMHSRIQQIATVALHMKLPESKDVEIVLAGKGSKQE